MIEQLTLIDQPAEAKLTARQQEILDAVRASGIDGVDTETVGALLHARTGKHPADRICRWCGRDGKSILQGELRPKGLVRYRRGTSSLPGGWVAVALTDSPHQNAVAPPDYDGDGPVPFNSFPANF